jgi:integrase
MRETGSHPADFPHRIPHTLMAYIRKIKSGYRAEVERLGVRKSQVFTTKAAAQAWAAVEEGKILSGKAGNFPSYTLKDAFDRYEREVSKKKRGAHAESLRFTAWLRDFPVLCGKVMHQITPDDIAGWRDERLKAVSASSVVRESAQLRNVWTVASNEWGWCGESPWKRVKLPAKAHARTRQTGWREVKLLVRHMGYVTGKAPTTPQMGVAWAYMVAQHTAMRAGEVRGLSRSTVDLERRVVTLNSHKTLEREGVRFVPITRKAARLLRVLDDAARLYKRDEYFTMSPQSLDVLFRKVRDRLLLEDLHFHDSRADALTRLSRRMDVMTLAKISGHRDLNQLLSAYYRETAADIAARI